jgi:AcrR family transcriptional regulator
MERIMADVKPRRYDSPARRQQALRTRNAVLDAAQARFLDVGYAAGTVLAIADDAGVSVETVYKSFGGKAGLVRAIWERGLAGRGPVPAYERSDAMQATEAEPAEIIRNWGVLTAEVAPAVAPILLLIRAAAAADPEMAELLAETDSQRLARMRRNARELVNRNCLRPELTLARAADILWTYSSSELYELLVLRRGWPLPRYGRFVGDALIGALLP